MEGRVGLPKGTVLDGSYRIERVIGSGGFGITYVAEDVKLSTKVAIKEYFPTEFGYRDASLSVRPKSAQHTKTFEWGRTSFLQEARTLARFRHPSVVQVTRVFEVFSTAYMVMAFEPGQSFEGWLKRLGRLPTQEEIDRISGPILDALEMMHGESFLHRDIAPDNIIVRADGTPVLLDFGAARRAVAEESRSLTGIVKSGYSPQEQYATDGRLQGPWTDIYAFGATLYRAVTGKVPEESTLRAIDDRMLPAASVGDGKYRPGFLEAIDACLEVHHADRPQSVAQARSMLLTRPAGEIPPPAHVATAPLVETRKMGATNAIRVPAQRSTKAWWTMFFAAVIAVVGGGVFGGLQYTRWQAEERGRVEADAKRRADQEAQRQEEAKRKAEEERRIAPGQEFQECKDCPRMIVVPGGSFMMGSPPDEESRASNENPQHKVTIAKPFGVGKFEVTFAEWDACVAAGGCKHKPNDHGWGRGKRPVIDVSWNNAKEYVSWLANKTGRPYRLLSEAEWEYAARAGTTTAFSTGRTITTDQANFDGDYTYAGSAKGVYRAKTIEVGSLNKPNAFGLHDMHGNVWEWVEDCYLNTYSGAPTNGRAVADAPSCSRVLRGGSWYYIPRFLRSANRDRDPPDNRNYAVGFRVARTLEPAAAAVAPDGMFPGVDRKGFEVPPLVGFSGPPEAMDSRLQTTALWRVLKRDFPDWYAERLKEAATLAAQNKDDDAIGQQMARGLVALRRQNVNHALAASFPRLKAVAATFHANLVALRNQSSEVCFEFISQGEASATVVALLQGSEHVARLQAQLTAVFEAIADGRKSPQAYPQPSKADYDTLAADLNKLGWTPADMQLFSNERALARAPPAKVCQLAHDWFAAQLAIKDPDMQLRLLVDSLVPVVAG